MDGRDHGPAMTAMRSPKRLIQELPSHRAVEMPDANGRNVDIVEEARIHAHALGLIGVEALPMGEAAAIGAANEGDHFIAPYVAIERVRRCADLHLARVVIGHDVAVAPADRAIAGEQPLRQFAVDLELHLPAMA